ncbi:hypothetical protein [Algoriphagus winogradskyi]|uniref:Uncharacterized protein n=1 Tax=Algoriphagus winogradskyi TaxID=237017 RepID=A0ABY1NHC7_9BACT|nr:hypothetical protein [Algoriphagus winogradskyi]SMP07815.1 hypothetical protein SAMN06265367_101644 [Algoriphagus winogradskyi]
MKKLFGIASLIISILTFIILVLSYFKELDSKELTLSKDYQDIYISDIEDYIRFYDSLGENEYLNLMPSQIKLEIPPYSPNKISISEWVIKNTGHIPIKNDKKSNLIKIQLPLESKIYSVLLEGSYLSEDPKELQVDTLDNSVTIDEFLLNKGDELWITIIHEFPNAKPYNLNPLFIYKGEGITGFKSSDEWDPFNLNKYIYVYTSLNGIQILIFFVLSVIFFIVGSFRVIVFKFSNRRKLLELIFVFIISICLGEILTYLLFGKTLSLEIASILSVFGIIYYLRLYLFLKNN